MAKINYPNTFFLGANLLNPKVYYAKIKELIDAINGVQVNVTQLTSATTSVAFEGDYGKITTVSLTTAAATKGETFTVTNSKVISTSVISLTTEYNSAGTGSPVCIVENVTTGSFNIRILNVNAASALNRTITLGIRIKY
jgi:hypothetical protein